MNRGKHIIFTLFSINCVEFCFPYAGAHPWMGGWTKSRQAPEKSASEKGLTRPRRVLHGAQALGFLRKRAAMYSRGAS